MKIINSASRVLGLVGTGIVTAIMLLIVSDVFLRFAFNRPITGTPEICELMMMMLALTVAWAAVGGKHISVDLVMNRFKPRVQAVVDSVTLLAGLVIAVIITWQSYLTSIWILRFHYIASVLVPIPTFPFHWLFVLGWGVLCLAMVTLVIQRVAEALKR